MGKKVTATLRLHIAAGAASPGPPVGPSLGQHGLNIMMFCKAFNSKMAELKGVTVPVDITVYSDRSFTFETRIPITSDLIKKAAKIERGSGVPNREKVAKFTYDQVVEIAKVKMPDLYAADFKAVVATVKGTARSMGVDIID